MNVGLQKTFTLCLLEDIIYCFTVIHISRLVCLLLFVFPAVYMEDTQLTLAAHVTEEQI